MSPTLYFWLSVVILAALLSYPVSKLIWVLSVRRLERKLGHELSERDRLGQLRRARFIAVPLVLFFSWLFNLNILGYPGGG